jgi:hypothetical protein
LLRRPPRWWQLCRCAGVGPSHPRPAGVAGRPAWAYLGRRRS